MKTHRFSTPRGIALWLGLLLLATGVFEAVTTIVDPDTGHLLTVDVISDPVNPALQGVRLSEQPPGGSPIYQTIPSTYDPIIDSNPVLAKSPSTDLVVVWSRRDGDDFELALSRRTAGLEWEPLTLLTDNYFADTNPRVVMGLNSDVHILWWANDAGGPVQLQSFDPSGLPLGPPQRPFEPPAGSTPPARRGPVETIDVDAGGLDDPGIPKGFSRASAYPCLANPAAVPDHGIVTACGDPAAWQLTSCQLVVGVRSSTGTWSQTMIDLSNLGSTASDPRLLAQVIADQACN
ncbi:MAG: hypothetical protein ACREAA_14030 [Candidatus Polarisedimenticolia bacterium]